MSAEDATHPPRPNAENMGSHANLVPLLDQTGPKGDDDKTAMPLSHEPTSTASPTEKLLLDKPLEQPANPPSPEDDLTTKIFRFLSTATPGTLSSVAVGLAAVTYFILGQIGLLLIGALGGIAFYIHWEASNPDFARAVHGETGLDVVTRLLGEKTDPKQADAERDIVEHDEEQFRAQSFADFQPETREALNELVDAVIRDYVKWWYSPILPSDRSFPLSCRKVFTSFLVSIGNHLGKKRPADSFLDFLTNSSSMVIVFFSELSKAFSVLAPDSKMTAADAVYNYLASNPESTLAHLLSQRHQASKFKAVAEDLLDFLERPTYECDPARTFLREIMAGTILEMSLQSCSKAEWINGWIVYLLEAGEPDFNQAIDVGMQTGPDANAAVFADMDGNVGNIGIPKGSRSSVERSRSSLEQERTRRRDSSQVHKKKLSKADEEMEAVEEMKRMNQMILEADVRRSPDSKEAGSSSGVTSPDRPIAPSNDSFTGLDVPANRHSQPTTPGAPSPAFPGHRSPDQNPLAEERPSTDPGKSPMSTSPMRNPSPLQGQQSAFTSFEQLVPPAQDDSDLSDAESRRPAPLTLHNAKVTIYDDSTNDKSKIRAKPSWDYLIQIEPNSSHYSGWMIARQYSDFEKLHEVLRRIATVSGITAFTEQHKELPHFKLHTRESLRGELERYVRDACWYKPLAESEGMKRFLDKDQGHTRTESKSGFQAVESFGKNVFGVLASAPKGVAEGGKVIAGGVTGVFGNMGLSRKSTQSSLPENAMNGHAKHPSTATPPPPRMEGNIPLSGTRKPRDSLDSQRSSVVSTQPGKMPLMERRPSYQSQGEPDAECARKSLSDRWDGASPSTKSSRANSRASSLAALRSPLRSPSSLSLDALKLPPPPDAMPDDWSSPDSPRMTRSQDQILSPRTSADVDRTGKKNGGISPINKLKRQHSKMSEQETRVAVELVFAIINELYTLSSAWNFRRTLLAAAKSFLLRPGNPSLVSIQAMLQESVIEANSSDSGIAHHLRKLRENGLPTEEELKAWPPGPSMEEKEKLREKARRLLIESGVPAALTGVMGQNATSEALGRIFDCLQIEEVARGLLFGIMLQAVRVITH